MDILMPQLGETVAEGKITRWYKAVGEKLAAGDALFEIETDKTSMEVPTTQAGVLSEIRVAAGMTVPVGSIVAVLASGAQAAASPSAPATAGTVARGAGPAPAARAFDPANPVRTPERHYGPAKLPSGIKVTPAARRMASEAGVQLGGLKGSGPHGHIVARDVQAAAGRAPTPAVAAGARAAGSAAPATLAVPTLSAAEVRALYSTVAFEELALDGMRRTVARRLTEAKQSIPHFYLSRDVRLDRLLSVRSEINADAKGQYKLSINDFIIKAVALALQAVPAANAVWADDRILRFKGSDVAVAVAIDGGLITPIIRGADLKGMQAISEEMKTLAAQARSRSLKPIQYQGGSITISNLGMFGVSAFSAIINPPQAAIIAVGAAERRPWEGPDGTVRFGSVITATLSCDHRVIDGALGAQLIGAFAQALESPLRLLA